MAIEAAFALDDKEQLAGLIARQADSGDLVMCLGAGSISQWAAELPASLAAIKGGSR